MTPRSALIWTLAGFFGVAAAGVLLRPLLPVDETRYVAVAWEMWLNGDYLVPTRNFEIYTHKPPLLFWLINLVWAVTGVSETAARLVGPFSATATIWITARLADRLWPEDPWIGARAAGALAGLSLFAISGGLTMFDTLLAMAVVAAMLALTAAARSEGPGWWVAVGLAIGVGVLAKGPVVLIHVLPAMLCLPVWSPLRQAGLRVPMRRIGLALAVACAVVALWLVPAVGTGGAEYRDAILWTQSAGRIAQSFAHARPWWFFLALAPVLLFPWVLVPAIWRAAVRAPWAEPGLRLAVIWSCVALGLFSLISGKQVHYLVPELPAIALVVARLTRDLAFRPVLPAVVIIAIALSAIVASTGMLPLGGLGPLMRPATVLLAVGLLLLAVSFGAIRMGGLAGGLVLTLGSVMCAYLLIGLTGVARTYDSHELARLVAPSRAAGIGILAQEYNAEFNFAGRLEAPVAILEDTQALLRWAAAHREGVVLCRMDRPGPSWPPRRTVAYRDRVYGVWYVADAPPPPDVPTS